MSVLKVANYDIASRMVTGSIFPPFGSFENGSVLKRDNDEIYQIYVNERRQVIDGKLAFPDRLQLLYASEMNLIPIV